MSALPMIMMPVSPPVVKTEGKADISIDAALVESPDEAASPSANFEALIALLFQGFTPPAQNNNPETAPSFGGGFSVDPALLVFEDGVPVINPDVDLSSLPPEILKALTAGLPEGIPLAPMKMDAMTVVTPDTRLIATGLTPEQLTTFQDYLNQNFAAQGGGSVSVQASTTAPTPATDQMMFVNLVSVPDEAATGGLNIAASKAAVSAPAQDAVQMSVETPVVSAAAQTAAPAAPVKQVAANTDVSVVSVPVTTEGEAEAALPINPLLAEKSPLLTSLESDPYAVDLYARETGSADTAYTSEAKVAADATVEVSGSIEKADFAETSALSMNKTSPSAWNMNGFSVDQGLFISHNGTIVSGSTLTSPVLQQAHAAQAHPATQIVANALQKTASSDGPKTLAIELDPPELGRVYIDLKMEKDNPLHVRMVVESAETYQMLKRDSHALENALQQSGLKSDGISLDLQLASDHGGFEQALAGYFDERQSGGSSRTGEAKARHSLETQSAPLEASVDWYTDDKTGRLRYNLMA